MATSGYSESWLSRLFQPTKVKQVAKHKTSRRAAKKITKPQDTFEVDAQWIATYREQEVAWDYFIPDDDHIRFENGKFYVPAVVFRHYQDMLNAHDIKLQHIRVGDTAGWCNNPKDRIVLPIHISYIQR